jgi:hypothetical protein
MALADIETRFTVPHKTCSVCYWMSERGDEWADQLRALLRDRNIRFKDLAKALYDDPDEPNIPNAALSRHSQRGCSAQESLR